MFTWVHYRYKSHTIQQLQSFIGNKPYLGIILSGMIYICIPSTLLSLFIVNSSVLLLSNLSHNRQLGEHYLYKHFSD